MLPKLLFLVFLVVVAVGMFLCCYVVKQASGRAKSKRGAKKWNNFQSKLKGAVMFPNVKIMVFLLFVFRCLYVCFFKNTISIGVSANFGHLFFGACLGAKRWVNKWSTLGSISGPHVGSNF